MFKSIFRKKRDSPLSKMSYTLTDFNELCKRIQNNVFKILIVGDVGVGKTSIIKQAALNCYSPFYKATIGVDFVLKRIKYNGHELKLQLWDIAGQERYSNMTRVYYKDAIAAFIVFDVTRPDTFDSILKWKDDLDQKVLLPDGSFIPCIILANKCDDPNKNGIIITPDKIDEFCATHGFLGWFETSAKENIGITAALERLSKEIVANIRDMFPYIEPGFVEEERIKIAREAMEKQRFDLSKCLTIK